MESHPLRFDPRIAKARTLVKEGALGEVFRASSRQHLCQWPYAADSWKLDRERGGGALLECGLDFLDAAWFALGCPDPMEAMAASYRLFSQRFRQNTDVIAEDCINGLIRHKDGSILQHAAQIHLGSMHAEPEQEIRLWGSKGSLDLLSGKQLTGSAEEPYAKAIDESERFRKQAHAFVKAVRQGGEVPNAGKQALATMKMLDALARSAKEKHAVSIKVERSLDDLFGGL